MQKFTDLIDKRLNQHKLGDSAKASRMLHLANEFLFLKMGSDASEVRALKLKEGTLTIGSVSSVWSQELWAHQDSLLTELQNKCGKKSVLKIHISGLTEAVSSQQ